MKIAYAAILLLFVGDAWAQNAVTQTGSVTPNSVAMWAQNRVLRQGSGVAGAVAGQMPTGGFSVVGGVCDFSNTTNIAGYHKLCLDATNAALTYDGTSYSIFGTGTGNVNGPATTTTNELASFNATNGTLLKQGGPAQISGSGATFLWDPALTQNTLKYTATKSGAVTPGTDTNNAALLWYKQIGALSGGGVNTGITLVEFDITDTGSANNTDSYVAVAGNCNLTTSRTGAGFTACIGGSFSSRAFASQGGGVGSEKGEIHGLNVVTGMSSGAANYYDVEGIEIDIVTCSTCALAHRFGLYSVDYGDGAGGLGKQGSVTDAAIAIGSSVGTVGWKYGIDFVGLPVIGGNALSNTGTVLGSSASTPTVATNGIDLFNFVISGKAFRAPADAFYVTGAGDVLGKSITATANVINDTAVGSNALTDYRAGGVTYWFTGREATTNDFVIKTGGGTGLLRIAQATNNLSIGTNGPTIPAATGILTVGTTTLMASSVALTNGAGASTATLTNAPAATNPTKWIPIVDNGTTRYIPAW